MAPLFLNLDSRQRRLVSFNEGSFIPAKERLRSRPGRSTFRDSNHISSNPQPRLCADHYIALPPEWWLQGGEFCLHLHGGNLVSVRAVITGRKERVQCVESLAIILGEVLLPVLCLSPLITSPPLFHIPLNFYVSFIRRTSGRSLETFNKTNAVLNDGKIYKVKYSHVVFQTATL